MKSLFILFGGLLVTASVFSQSWSLTGNSGTTNSNFVGTTDDRPLIFKVGNVPAGYTGYTANENVAFGYNALVNLHLGAIGNTAMGAGALRYSQGKENVGIGHWALLYNGGDYNVAVGSGAMAHSFGTPGSNVAIGGNALKVTTTSGSVAVGFEAGLNNTSGEALTATGFKALFLNTTGSYNTANGFNSLFSNTTGSKNTAVGFETLRGNTTGFNNTAIGMKALNFNTTADNNTAVGHEALWSNNTGVWNVAFGAGALASNTSGNRSTAVGTSALHHNTIGMENTAIGEEALGGNIDGSFNTAVGIRALWCGNNTPVFTPWGHGSRNTSVGFESLRELTSGSYNTATGFKALNLSTTGANNTAFGTGALSMNTTGSYNAALGAGTSGGNTTGNYNTVIGYGANVSNGGLTNATAIGNGAIATANNQVTIGNSSVTSIRGYANWTTISDGRVKKNIRQDVPGLAFINKLQPVTYTLDLEAADKLLNPGSVSEDQSKAPSQEEMKLRKAATQAIHTGFVAQEVEKAAKSLGYDFSGVDIDETGNSLYGLRYAEFVTPLVKAVQELSAQIDAKDTISVSLQSQIDELKEQVNQLISQKAITGMSDNNINFSSASLQQNFPNPFTQVTTIQYTLPQTLKSAKIVVVDINGRVLKQIPVVCNPGQGSVNLEAGSLTAGIYYYSLHVDGRLVDTKKMVLSK